MRPCEYFESYGLNRSHAPGLGLMSSLMEKLGNPQNGIKFIHIAGTNGKGSVSEMLYEILRAQGYSVGLYTSPHLIDFNERVAIDGRYITDEELESIITVLKPAVEDLGETPNEFELVTAAAFLFYARMKPDYVVLECGLGGRLDSTNIIKSKVLSVITGVDFDHMAILGNTIEQIAYEKAGIIYSHIPVVFGEGADEAYSVAGKRAEELDAPMYRTDYSEINCVKTSLDGTEFAFEGKHYSLSTLGTYQTRNAAVVLTSVRAMRDSGIEISDEAVRTGLKNACWKARFEILNRNPLIIYDGAHNIQGVRAAYESINDYLAPLASETGGKINVIMGVMKDKQYCEMIRILSDCAYKVYCVTPGNRRSLDAFRQAELFDSLGIKAHACRSIDEALGMIRADIPTICVGSLYMYEEAEKAVSDHFRQ